MRIDQLTSGFAFGDAISGDIREIQKVLRNWGYESDVFVDPRFVSPKLRGQCRDFREYKHCDAPGNIMITHFSIGSVFHDFLKSCHCTNIMKYHNITPAKFFEGIDPRVAETLRGGRKELKGFADIIDLALGDSDYNRQELDDLGYKKTGTLPIMLDLKALDGDVDEKVLAFRNEAYTNIVFVGRVVPNKKFEDVIKAFYFYQKTCNPASRLFLVGGYRGFTNYYTYLNALINELGIQRVKFSDHVSDETLRAFFKIADAFVCMSEHEGFCIPLVEAMYRKIPVIAYDAGAVGETLGGSGILFKEKNFEAIAEAMHLVTTDQDVRKKIAAAQTARLTAFSRDKTEEKLKTFLQPFLNRNN